MNTERKLVERKAVTVVPVKMPDGRVPISRGTHLTVLAWDDGTPHEQHYTVVTEGLGVSLVHPSEIDLLRDVKVEVTEEHIKHGVRKECFTCPLALALKPLLKPGTKYGVASNVILFDMNDPHESRVYLERDAFDWVGNYDRGISTAKPTTFTFAIPERFLLPA